MPFDFGRMKKYFSTLLMVGILITVVWGIINFALFVIDGGNPIGFLGNPSFMTMIILLILEWVGYLMLHGKFQVPDDQRMKMQQQPKQQQKYQQPTTQIPVKIETDFCSYCEKEKPITEFREFKDSEGNVILVCKNCLGK